MKKLLFFLSFLLCTNAILYGQKDKKQKAAAETELDSASLQLLKKLSALTFKTEGTVPIADGKANLKVPAGFKYLDAQQTHFVLEELWGNPPQTNDGMLFLAEADMLSSGNWAFIVSFEDDGHIDDSDAGSINYSELLTQMKEDTKEGSAERVKMGYEGIELIGWASPPYYDAEKKTLHWAKEIKFGQAEENTLNYDVRILGRSGLISMNAVGSIKQLDEVKGKIPDILSAVTFAEGNKYWDFNPNIDKVAAVGIGGLVAGKVLAKAGLFVILLKYIKVIGLAVVAGGSWIWKKITGRSEGDS
jgi:uncharacterized membrane-anchored protein